jgi:ABC-type sugar transport system ATPase subunit
MIAVEGLSIRNGGFALDGIGLAVPTGEYGVLMGQTGCGKSTLLECICGLKPARGGAVLLQERDVTRLKPAERGIGYVPQDGVLFRTMTVRQNLGFALRVRRWRRRAIRERVEELADLLGIEHLLNRRTLGLSGGETQRVAIGRALAARPGVLCLDEPLSSLDHDTRQEMCTLLKNMQRHTHVTTLHVTHDRDQARKLADRLFQFVDGRIEQVL